MPTNPSLALLALTLSAIISSSDALVAFSSTTSSPLRPPRYQYSTTTTTTTTLTYSDGDETDGGNALLPRQFDPRAIRRLSSWRIPRTRRAVSHIQNASKAEAATRAGFSIQRGASATPDTLMEDGSERRAKTQTERKVSRAIPRTIRRIVLRQSQQEKGVHHNLIPAASNRFLLFNHSQLDGTLDTSDLSSPTEEQQNGARRVTFKATKEASKTILSKSFATLTDFMTQPVSQYSLLDYHDAEGMVSTNDTFNQQSMMSRRWLIRRLTKEESRFYFTDTPSYSSSSSLEGAMNESNLFRLAVPLFPLIGWDLTPVIDLEVIPPKKDSVVKRSYRSEDEVRASYHGSLEGNSVTSTISSSYNSWAPLQGIRKRISHRGGYHEFRRDNTHSPSPVVKIRSLRVSLLSTQKEVNEIMMNESKSGKLNQKGGEREGSSNSMQREAIEMVGRVEEWLKPHITFEAEISWDDGYSSSSSTSTATPTGHVVLPSNVTVKSTAITSLTVPKIPSEILRNSVPSAFLVKRLGATLTSRALAICLPRFLTQLEKDYNRWSGL